MNADIYLRIDAEQKLLSLLDLFISSYEKVAT